MDILNFDKQLLLRLANTEAGRHLLGISGKGRIIKLTNNSVHVLLGIEEKRAIIEARFWANPQILQEFLTPMQRVLIAHSEYRPIQDPYEAFLHYAGLQTKYQKYPQIFLSTIAPNANAGGDGFIQNGDASYATSRGASSGSSANNSATTIEVGNTLFGGTYFVSRGYIPFDTSSLTALATISAATLQVNNANINGGTNTFYIVASTQASATALATSDYSLIGSTAYSASLLDFTSTGIKSQALNATGIAAVSKTSYTKLGLRHKGDFENTTPVAVNRADASSSDDATSGNRPLLTVTYSLPGGLLGSAEI